MDKKIFVARLFFTIVLSTAPYAVLSQTETFGSITFTPPNGWTRATKEGVVIFTSSDKTSGRFCVLTIHAATPSGGNAQTDFSAEWSDLIVKPFKADANPTTEANSADGWTAVAGGSQIESDGTKAIVIMTVFSGFGKSVATYAMFNDQSYIPQLDAFNTTIKIDKTITPALKAESSGTGYTLDPFPDKPNYQPQKPLLGPLKKSITIADLVGHWQSGAASVTSYYNSSSGNYSSTDTVFYGESFDIKPNGAFDFKFAGRSGNHTIRETDVGTVALSGQFVTLNYKVRAPEKFQFVSFMVLPNGGAVLSLIHLGANESALDAERLAYNCGHPQGFITCQSGEVFTRGAPPK